MNMNKPKISHLLVVLSLLPACSRAITCATEGCSNERSVTLSAPLPLPVGSSADAVVANPEDMTKVAAAQKALEEKFGKITDRVSLNEALGVLHSQTLELHEQRLKSLEEGSKRHQENLNSLGVKVTETQAALAGLDLELESKFASLSEDLAEQAAKEAKEIEALKGEVQGVSDEMLTATEALADADKEQMNSIIKLMSEERKRVDAADQAIREQAIQSIGNLQSQLDLAVKKLTAADKENLKIAVEKMRTLDVKITEVALVGTFVAARLASEISELQRSVCDLDKTDQENYKKLKDKISALTTELNTTTAQLSASQKAALSRIGELEAGQGALNSNLSRLDRRVEFYRKAQVFIDAVFATQILALDGRISSVRSDLQSQINEIKVNASKISSTILGLSNALDTMKGEILSLQETVNAYGSRMDAGDDAIDALELEVAGMQGNYTIKYNAIMESIGNLNTMISAKSECTVGDMSRDLFIKYRSFTCDGVTFKVVVL